MQSQLEALISYPGSIPFIYIHHPHHPTTNLELPSGLRTSRLDTIEYHTPRLLYTGILHGLGSETDELATWDAFARALRDHLSGKGSKAKGKRKAVEMENGDENGVEEAQGAVVVVTHAERLRTVLGSGWTVMTRLAELTGANVTLVLCSAVPWEELRPPRADAPEPIHLFLPAPTRDEVLQALLPASTHPLWSRFLDLLLSSLLHLTASPIPELEYIAEALWPIYTSSLPPHEEQLLLNRPFPNPDTPPAPLPTNIKLLTDLKHALAVPLAVAAEDLITRRVGIEEFKENMKRPIPGTPSRALARASQAAQGLVADLAQCGKYLIVAGYCASYNPAKSDQRLFGRIGADGKRRRGGGNRRAGYGRTRIGKVPQRLLGPKLFSLDRLLALFASLYAEHASRPEDLVPTLDDGLSDEDDDDAEMWRPTLDAAQRRAERIRQKEQERDQMWEDEVDHLTMSTRLWGLIPELESQGLLRRMSPLDRLDNITLRCEVDYEEVKSIAKDLKITLDEYLYEATT